MNAKSFHLSAQGASHIKKNKECQDASTSYFDDECAIAIVCDGHGGNDYVRSAIGSTLACAVAEKNIKSFATNVKPEEMKLNSTKLIKNLEASIINGWNEAIYMHYEANPFLESELSQISEKAKKKYLIQKKIESAYGTTLIAVMMTKDYWIGIQIGDGKCVAVNQEGKFLQPIPWDDKCFLNATTSICDSSALENFRHFYSEKLPVAVFVGSDGIDDCFSNDEQLNNLYKTVLYSFATTPFEEAIDGLKDYLPRLSAKGSGDDVSVAAMMDIDKIGDIDSVKAFDEEKEKAKVEERARKEAEKAELERLKAEEERLKQAPKDSNTRFCENCGAKVVPGMKFCSECGSKIVDKASVKIADEVNEHIEDELQIINISGYKVDINDALQKTDGVEYPEIKEDESDILEKNHDTEQEKVQDGELEGTNGTNILEKNDKKKMTCDSDDNGKSDELIIKDSNEISTEEKVKENITEAIQDETDI